MSNSPDGAKMGGNTARIASEAVSEKPLHALWRLRWTIVASVLICTVLGGYLSYRQQPVYSSQATLLFEQYASRSGSTGDVSDPFLQSQADLLMSTPVINSAAASLQPMHLRSLQSLVDVPATLQSQLETSVKASDGTVTVSYSSPVASDSATIVNTIVEAYRKYELSHREASITDQLSQLQHDRNGLDAQVATLQGKLQDFKKINPDFSLGYGSTLAAQKLVKLNEQLTDAQTNYTNLSARCDALTAQLGPKPPTPALNTSGSDNADVDLAWAQNELNRASANVDALISKGLPPTDPAVQDARSYLTRMRDKLVICQQNAAYADLDKLKQDTGLALQKQTQLQASLDAQKQVVSDLGNKSAECSALTDQLQRAQQASADLVQKMNQIVVTRDVPLDMRVLQPAEPAGSSWDSRIRTVRTAAAVGLLIGLLIGLGSHLTDDRLRSPAQVAAVTGLQVLATIPHQAESELGLGFKSQMDPMSDVAEAARNVRTALFAAARSTPSKTVLVTSPCKGDGKSIFASNLAISMAQAGNRTLLIDANFGQQFLQQIFDVKKVSGFSNVLAGHITVDKAICRTPVERLEIFPSGQAPPNSEMLLNSPALGRVMEYVCARYQCVIVDSPALQDSSDARILSASADISLLIVRLGKTEAKLANAGMDQLLSVGARLLGAVVNDASARSAAGRSRGIAVSLEPQLSAPAADLALRVGHPDQPALQRRRAITGRAVKKDDANIVPDVEVLD